MAVVLLMTMIQGPAPTIEIRGPKTKLTCTLTDASDIMSITTKTSAQRHSVKVRQAHDQNSPQFYQAWKGSEKLSSVLFKVYKPGDPKTYKIITLTNATISNIQGFKGGRSVSVEGKDTYELEEVSFNFQTIKVENIAGSTSTSDDWTTPNQ